MSGTVDLPADVAALLTVYRQAQDRIAELETLIKDLRARIEAVLGDAETGLVDGRPAVRWTRITRRALDQKLLREGYPDLYEACLVEQVSRRFTLVTERP